MVTSRYTVGNDIQATRTVIMLIRNVTALFVNITLIEIYLKNLKANCTNFWITPHRI